MNVRTSKPSGNKFYLTVSKGGYSQCVQGRPTDTNANVLSNCVGYACGRFNEIIGEMKYPKFYCDAENFIEKAQSYGLEISNVPTLGGIMVWAKGSISSHSDGAGHVAIVERIDNANQIYTSESCWGGSAFYNAIRTNNNGRWGMSAGYTYRGCIVNPAIGETPTPQPAPTPVEVPTYEITAKTGLYLLDGNGKNIKAYVKGTRVTYLGTGYTKYGYNYIKVKVSTDGQEGYMAKIYLKEVDGTTPQPTPQPSEKHYKVIANSGLWLLDANGKNIKAYVKGTEVVDLGNGYTKYGYTYIKVKVLSDGKIGYMAKKYLG